MNAPAHRTVLLAGAALLAFGAATPAPAQYLAALSADAEADRLHAAALQREWTAAEMREIEDSHRDHVAAARLRGPTDPRAGECLIHAANLLFLRHPEKAVQLLEEAGDHAMARGDPGMAARAYADLSWIAAKQVPRTRTSMERARWAERAVSFGRRAQLLATSPLVPDATRERVGAMIHE